MITPPIFCVTSLSSYLTELSEVIKSQRCEQSQLQLQEEGKDRKEEPIQHQAHYKKLSACLKKSWACVVSIIYCITIYWIGRLLFNFNGTIISLILEAAFVWSHSRLMTWADKDFDSLPEYITQINISYNFYWDKYLTPSVRSVTGAAFSWIKKII